tara:strand:- start:657 stop:1502 length:846 start_codon:yes stop_codon:yes gene_type:complete
MLALWTVRRRIKDIFPFMPPESPLPDLLASAGLLSALLLGWLLTGSALKRREGLPLQVARRWTANVRNGLVLIAIIGLLMIWAPQLRTFALSLTAFAVALVIATKELILCLSGSAYRTFTRAYTIGQIVEIGGHCGEVVDISLLSTQIRELDRNDGSIGAADHSVVVPHSLLLSQPLRIVAKDRAHTEHRFDLVFETDIDLFSQRAELEKRAVNALEKNRFKQDQRQATDLRLAIGTTDLGRIRLSFTLKVSPENAEACEQAVATAIGSMVLSEVFAQPQE